MFLLTIILGRGGFSDSSPAGGPQRGGTGDTCLFLNSILFRLLEGLTLRFGAPVLDAQKVSELRARMEGPMTLGVGPYLFVDGQVFISLSHLPPTLLPVIEAMVTG